MADEDGHIDDKLQMYRFQKVISQSDSIGNVKTIYWYNRSEKNGLLKCSAY